MIKNMFPKLFLLIIVFIISITSCKPFQSSSQRVSKLLVWSLLEDEKCHIWVIDPVAKTVNELSHDGATCDYGTAKINNEWKPFRLVKSDGEYVLELVELKSDDVTVIQQYPIPRFLTSEFQWGGEVIFVSGIEDSKERIFQINTNSGSIAPYIERENGFVSDPNISPDGTFLAYSYWDVPYKNRLDCQLTCFSIRYFVRKLSDGEEIDLLPLINDLSLVQSPHIQYHCQSSRWSKTGQYFAFQTGCESHTSIFVFDTTTSKMLPVFIHPDSVLSVSSEQNLLWTEKDELLYSVDGMYFLFDPKIATSTPLDTFSGFTYQNGYQPIWHDIVDNNMLGTVGGFKFGMEAEGISAIMVINLNGELVAIPTREISGYLLQAPKWSLSDSYIAAIASDVYSPRGITMAQIHIISTESDSESFNVSLELDVSSMDFAWIE